MSRHGLILKLTRATSMGLAIAAIGSGCKKPPPEAPKELGEIGLFLFAHFEDEDPAEMGAGLLNLRDQILKMDLTLEPKDRAVTMPILKGDNLGGLAIPAGTDPDEQIPIALGGESIHNLDKQVVLAVEPNQICIESSSTKWAQREFLTDTACFEDASCDRLETVQEVRKESIIADVWYEQFKTYRWFDLEDEEGNLSRALVGRSWTEEQFLADGGNNSWDELFHLDVSIENPDAPGKTLRWFSLWSAVSLSLVGDDVYANLVIEGIGEALVFGDEFISDDIQSCRNDRGAPRPE